MKKFLYTFFAIFYLLNITSCSKDDDKSSATDTEKPTFESTNATPVDGQEFKLGDVIKVYQTFSDNVELGSFNIEIHNNFDGHSHSTESNSKRSILKHEHGDVENAWVYNKDFEIPAGLKNYTSELEIKIPDTIAQGDYHFVIRLTDKAGWQAFKAVELEVE